MERSTLEIKEAPLLESGQSRMLDFHSALNVLHALSGEIYLLGVDCPPVRERLGPLAERFDAIADAVDGTESPESIVKQALEHADQVESELEWIRAFHRAHPEQVTRNGEALRTIIRILRIRLDEIASRYRDGSSWRIVSVARVAGNLTDALSAIQKHSGGRFGMTFDEASQGESDYFIDLRFSSAHGTDYYLPDELEDILRDLVANARKYTAPGGKISIFLGQSREMIEVSVEDNGMGIPSAEISQVCDFGVRGTNAATRRTLGGGFGLTKAVSLVKLWGGRFWIASEEGAGTRIWFQVPVPDGARTEA